MVIFSRGRGNLGILFAWDARCFRCWKCHQPSGIGILMKFRRNPEDIPDSTTSQWIPSNHPQVWQKISPPISWWFDIRISNQHPWWISPHAVGLSLSIPIISTLLSVIQWWGKLTIHSRTCCVVRLPFFEPSIWTINIRWCPWVAISIGWTAFMFDTWLYLSWLKPP